MDVEYQGGRLDQLCNLCVSGPNPFYILCFVMLGLDSANRVSLPVAFCYSMTKGALQRTTELEEKGEWSFFPFFFFVSWALVNITRAFFPQSDRGTSFFTEAIELVCRFSSLCRIRFHCVPLRHQQLSLSIPSEKSESLLCGGSPLQIQTPGLVRSILSSEI